MARTEILSEVTGRVWKIISVEQAEVAEGDTILIIESMKMEIPIEAPSAGKVVEICVNEGEAVKEEQIVAFLDTVK